MIPKLFNLINRHWSVVCYLFFGGLTTLVNWIVYYGLLLLGVNAELANALAFLAGVIFAFCTERKTAFESDSKGKDLANEAWKFLGTRIVVWLVEQGLLRIGLRALHINKYIIKIPLAVVSAVLNWFIGRLVVFRKRRTKLKNRASARLWTEALICYPIYRFPVAYINAVRAARGAVSQRKIRGPMLQIGKPRVRASSAS